MEELLECVAPAEPHPLQGRVRILCALHYPALLDHQCGGFRSDQQDKEVLFADHHRGKELSFRHAGRGEPTAVPRGFQESACEAEGTRGESCGGTSSSSGVKLRRRGVDPNSIFKMPLCSPDLNWARFFGRGVSALYNFVYSQQPAGVLYGWYILRTTL